VDTRNLLVHHGGILTAQFNREIPVIARERTYFDSVPIGKNQIGEAALLALDVVKGTVKATVSNLSKEVTALADSDVRRQAFIYWEHEAREDAELSQKLGMLVTGESPFGNAEGITNDDVPF
jgi:hypothetical protein